MPRVAQSKYAVVACACALAVMPPRDASAQEADDRPPAIQRFLETMGRDFKSMASLESVPLLSGAAALALFVSPFDDTLTYSASCSTFLKTTFEGWARKAGQEWSLGGAALATYVAGHVLHNQQIRTVGVDLIEAQTVASITTMALKFAVSRTRPDGEARSFPSGHAAGTFATAAVVQRHFGWKAGVPAYAAAVLISGARLQANSHYSTDVIAGAAIGILAGRAATFDLARSRVSMSPAAVPGGVGVTVTIGPEGKE